MQQEQQREAGGVQYVLARKRVKNINLRVRPDGTVAASAPPRVSAAAVDAFVASRASWVRASQARLVQRAQARAAQPLPPRGEALALFEEVSAQVYPWFRNVLAAPPQIKVRDMTSRWGVCHPAKGVITLALRLAAQERAAVEYVVLHEYCHFVWPDHQPHFWALVGRYMPDYKARRGLLKDQ